MNKNYSVGITTYFRRFEDWFKPLLREIKRQRPSVEIIVSVNGEFDKDFYEDYRKNMLVFLSEFDNTFPVFYPRFRSMCKMWNTNIIMSTEDNTLLLEDDIELEDGFFDDYERILNNQMMLINGAYSAISVNKRDMIKVGWFDERFLGLGHEDGEFTSRYTSKIGLLHTTTIPTCKNMYGHGVEFDRLYELRQQESRLDGQRIDQFSNMYSDFNREVVQEIYDTPNKYTQYPYEEYYLDNKHRL